MVKAVQKEPLPLFISIRKAIKKGVKLFNAGKTKECYEIYLATAYQNLSVETMHGLENPGEEQSKKVIGLLVKATTDGAVEAAKSDYAKAAWTLRNAFDEILQLNNVKVSTGDSSGSSNSLKKDGQAEKDRAAELAELCTTMSNVLEIKSHTYLLKSYPDTFVGNKAVSKLVESKVCADRKDAVDKINQLVKFGLVYHVTRDHTFKDEALFYKLASTKELKAALDKFGHRTNKLVGEEFVHYATLLGRYTTYHKHPSLGVIRLDYDYPPAPGDIDHPDSYNYPVYYRVVPGLTFEMCQTGVLTPEVAKAFDEAVLWLANHKDVNVITGDCGFMFWFVERVRNIASKKCISLSPLMQLPGMAAACGPKDKILVLTANGKSLDPMRELIQRQCGVDSRGDQFVVVGCENVPHFGVEVAKGLKVDVEKAEPGIVKLTQEMIEAHPECRMILFECTELPPYSDAVREATRLPVMDAITNCDFFMQAFLDNGKFGLNGWYEEWDGAQEDYILGQNLDEGQKLQCIWCVKHDVHKFVE